MMTVTIWFSLLAICLLGAMSPGPSLAMIAKHSLAGGRMNGLINTAASLLPLGGRFFSFILRLRWVEGVTTCLV